MNYSKSMYNYVINFLGSEGATLDKIAEIALHDQQRWLPDLSSTEVLLVTDKMLKDNRVLSSFMVGIELDLLSEKQGANPLLQPILEADAGNFTVDEDLAIGVCNLAGSVALTTYGYLDVNKPGVIGEINNKPYRVFLDDLIASLVAIVEATILQDHVSYSV